MEVNFSPSPKITVFRPTKSRTVPSSCHLGTHIFSGKMFDTCFTSTHQFLQQFALSLDKKIDHLRFHENFLMLVFR